METQKITYYNEISMMMFGFGDSHKPNPETVRLVESIVLSQLRMIVQEALKYGEMRYSKTEDLKSDNKSLSGEDLVFLMRKNKYKMRRFIKYLNHKDLKKRAQSEVVDLTGITKNSLIIFIERIDETGELTDLTEFDEIKYERQVRADRISVALDEQKYMKFFKARCVSFNSKEMSQARNLEKLRLWVDPKKEINFSPSALDVLSYYAYETVAELTDYTLLVRLDSRRTTDPLNNIGGSFYTAAMFNGEHRFSGVNPDYSRVYNGQLPLSVNEVKEVMRRIYMPQVGKLNFGKKLPDTQYILAL